MQLAIQQHQAGRFAEAEQIYRQVLAERPNYGDALHLLGTLCAQRGDFDTAVDLIGRAVTANPKVAVYQSNLGNALREMGKPKEAIAAYLEVLRLDPTAAKDYANFAAAFRESGNLEAAMKACRRGLKLTPKLAELHHEMGLALLEKGDLDAAIASLRRAIAINPQWPSPHWNLSIALLLKGDYRQGWIEHEWRLQMKQFESSRPPFDKPKWDGEDLKGRTVLLTPEQSYGDMIQFIRYVPLIQDRGGHAVIARLPAWQRLLEGIPGLKQLETVTADSFDLYCPFVSLALAFATRVKSIPADIPYLLSDADLVEALGSKLDSSNGKLKIGIAWTAPPTEKRDTSRSISPAQLEPLNSVNDVEYYALQNRPTPPLGASPPDGLRLIDPPVEWTDYADIAALISYMDLVICVDSAVAHVAGAMGKTVWLMLSTRPDWRWLPGREDNPWYPTMRIFRQKSPGDWAEVVGRVQEALGEFVNARINEK